MFKANLSQICVCSQSPGGMKNAVRIQYLISIFSY